ncbi:MAG: ANTAR domain-containing response regulator [Acinetobacter sp.]|uniref:ANTAR domain-containing response regulator n=1 Tax=Acinetobacter sp. TaxID=472 RepID=UPI003D06A36B
MPKLKIVLINDDPERAKFIQASLIQHDFDVVASLLIKRLNMNNLQQPHADVILLDMDHPHRDIIESCVSQFDLPTVLFTKNGHKESIKNAIEAGLTAYIVDGIQPEKLDSILEIAIEQYKKHKKLLDDLHETRNKLADRKDIEKAKVLLIQMHGLAEEQAFNLLRKNAMSHRITMGEMARRLLDAQTLLQSQFKE